MTASGKYTFVIADLAGYTALTEAHGGAEAAKTVARYTEMASSALSPGVRLAERVGDQVLFVADDARNAVTTALALKSAVDREPLFLGVRIGIAAGVAVEQDGRYFGPALNIAARVAAHARGGQILCTGPVAAAVRGLADMRCVAAGPVRLKNVLEPIEIFEIVSEEYKSSVIDPVAPAYRSMARHTTSAHLNAPTRSPNIRRRT